MQRMSDTNEESGTCSKVSSNETDWSNFAKQGLSMNEIAEFLHKQESLPKEWKSILDWFDYQIEKVGKKNLHKNHILSMICYVTFLSNFFEGSKPSKLRSWKDKPKLWLVFDNLSALHAHSYQDPRSFLHGYSI